jgi:phosphoglycolate phosphatase
MNFTDRKYILMDLDGTITDPAIGITKSVQYALTHFDIFVEDRTRLYPFIGPPLKESFMEYYHLTEEQATIAINKYREYFADKGIYENEVYDGMEMFLQTCCEQGKTLFVATSKPTPFAEKVLEHFHLKHYFKAVYGSNLDGTCSAKEEIIRYALSSQQIKDTSEAVMIGDRKHDIEGAKRNGLNSIGVLYGYGSYKELTEAGADSIVNDIAALQQIIIG